MKTNLQRAFVVAALFAVASQASAVSMPAFVTTAKDKVATTWANRPSFAQAKDAVVSTVKATPAAISGTVSSVASAVKSNTYTRFVATSRLNKAAVVAVSAAAVAATVAAVKYGPAGYRALVAKIQAYRTK